MGEPPRGRAGRDAGAGQGLKGRLITLSDKRTLPPKAVLLGVLRRTGFPEETIRAVERAVRDPLDPRRDGNLLAQYGITRDRLVDRMGGSP